jgi:hypothetical protein
LDNDDDPCETIRDTPLGTCIGHKLLDITAEDAEEFLADPKRKSRVYFHFDNGETMFCTIGRDGDGLLGMLGTDWENDAG